MLGAAVAAPALPMAAAPAPVAAVYNRYTYGLAVFHARTHAQVTAAGIAKRLKVTPAQAKAMISEMSSAGLVKPVGLTGSNVRAVSNILKPDAWGLDAHARKQRMAERKAKRKVKAPEHNVTDMIAQLRQMCVDYGMTLHPRCTGGLA